MDFNIFGILAKLRDNKLWWVDVVFYFVISSLIAAILCYLIFAVKIYSQKVQIKSYNASLATVGTDEQKDMEKKIFDYQKKINDYAPLVKNHKISSNILAYLEKNTLQKVWFSRFSMGSSNNADIVLSGETENAEVFSKQISVFELSEYLTKITVLSSTLDAKNKDSFNLSLSLDPKIFNFTPKPATETINETTNSQNQSTEIINQQ